MQIDIRKIIESKNAKLAKRIPNFLIKKFEKILELKTGIVHIAPAFGADDANVGKKYNLPFLNPVGEDGKYTEGLWKGTNVFEVDLDVIKYLKENDKLFKKQKMNHNYPHCWRCDTPLLYYAKKSYYLEVTKLKDKLIEN